ncbi:MAG: hypothetical protein NTV38_01840 [Chloroflexi bacterium]|nr:hypothetical protein [Chloroflexota bacterium]
MPTYKIGLARIYLITIQAEDQESAKKCSESFIGESDLSSPDERKKYRFAIGEIEIVDNDVFECEDVEN